MYGRMCWEYQEESRRGGLLYWIHLNLVGSFCGLYPVPSGCCVKYYWYVDDKRERLVSNDSELSVSEPSLIVIHVFHRITRHRKRVSTTPT